MTDFDACRACRPPYWTFVRLLAHSSTVAEQEGRSQWLTLAQVLSHGHLQAGRGAEELATFLNAEEARLTGAGVEPPYRREGVGPTAYSMRPDDARDVIATALDHSDEELGLGVERPIAEHEQ